MNVRTDLAKAIAFVTITGLFTALVAMTMGDIRIQDEHSYTAVFRNVSGMTEGIEVRAAGVKIGSVKDLELAEDTTVAVTFTAASSVPLTTKTRAVVKYKNLTGDRYLDLVDDSKGGPPLPVGATIPVERTAPALDLDVLTNGFRPLMEGLSPQEINKLSSSLIAVFQGQSGAAESLLRHVGSLTSTLANRDKLIGSLIDNLNTVLGTANKRRTELGDTIGQLQKLTSGLAADRKKIGSSISDINDLASTTSKFLAELRPELTGTVKQVGRLSSVLNAEADTLDRYLGLLPQNLELTGRSSAYGSFFNFYMCGVRVKLSDAKGVPVYSPFMLSDAPRCQFKEGER